MLDKWSLIAGGLAHMGTSVPSLVVQVVQLVQVAFEQETGGLALHELQRWRAPIRTIQHVCQNEGEALLIL